ncbi:disaggregatase related repeat-containing protein [uncultured Methanomethylovorans sp.]|uniref:disaggregatase related repeat-containing protein n=1 Tax=uncultured Methanomethylovorans sp. TaxID=183759 RepID=UPI002AA61756|nr:disaggregatase related repeat-containing protein [uncultured Methanomethylovorans sp.]
MQTKLIRSVQFGLLLFLLMMITGICSAEIINVQQVSSFGSDREIEGVEVVGNYAYVLQLGDLVVLGVTDPTKPLEVNRINPPTNTYFDSITTDNNYAYVIASDYSTGTSLLMIFNIDTPKTPKLVGQYTNLDLTRIIKVSNNYAYLLSSGKGCLILDVSVPASPKLVGQYSLNDITTLDVSNQYLYLASGHYLTDNAQTGSFMVIDISNPAKPKLVGQYTNSYIFNDVAVSGQYAYLANRANGLIVLDISNPTIPQIVGKLSETGSDTEQVVISAKYAYVLNSDSDVYSLEIVNIANPKAPTLVDQDYYTGYLEDPVEHYSAFDGCGIGDVSGVYIYMISDYGGLEILKTGIQNQNSVSYTPTYDNRLRSDTPTTVLSTTTFLDIGKNTATAREVMMFDLSSYKTTDTISKATLSLYWHYPAGKTRTSGTIVEVYRPFEWNPKYVTWNSRASGTSWIIAGGSWYDKNAISQGTAPYASVTFPAGTVPGNKYYDFDVTQLVKEYVTGKYKNTGFFLKAKTESGNYIAFYSSEYSNAGMKPKLTITSSSGSTLTDYPPVANAGADRTATVGSAVTFNGSASTDDKGIASYSWDFDSSNGITADATSKTASKTYTAAGNYIVTLTVTDTAGQKSTDTLQVVVSGSTSAVSYTPRYDNRLRSDTPTTVLSTTNYLDIGKSTATARDVMIFDLSSYKTTDTISKATLSLYWYHPAGKTRTSATVVEIYRPVEWDPKYVTWNSRASGTLWSKAGGSWFDKNAVSQGTTPYASVTFSASTVPGNKYYEFDVTQLVKEYVSGKYKNTGFFLKAKTESGNYIAFYSSEYSNAAMRPKLTITR